MAEETKVTIDTATVPQVTAQPEAPKVEIDYDKIASLVEGKQKVAEEQVLKGYFKQQGLTPEEAASAIDMFKKDKAAREPNVEDMQRQITDGKTQVEAAVNKWLEAETKLEAYKVAPELGIDAATLPYVLKMADTSKVIKDGVVDTDELKESLTSVLNDVPQLKVQVDNTNGFKIGADNDNGATTNAELAKIFGVEK